MERRWVIVIFLHGIILQHPHALELQIVSRAEIRTANRGVETMSRPGDVTLNGRGVLGVKSSTTDLSGQVNVF